MYASLGFSTEDAAKFLQVSPRTVQLWVSGRQRIPYAAFKLLRVMLRYELPGKAWAGWSLSAGRLYTPEGFELAPHEVSWWSLLVRQARSFRALYAERNEASDAGRLADGRGACARPVGQPAASSLPLCRTPGKVVQRLSEGGAQQHREGSPMVITGRPCRRSTL